MKMCKDVDISLVSRYGRLAQELDRAWADADDEECGEEERKRAKDWGKRISREMDELDHAHPWLFAAYENESWRPEEDGFWDE